MHLLPLPAIVKTIGARRVVHTRSTHPLKNQVIVDLLYEMRYRPLYNGVTEVPGELRAGVLP